MTRLLSILSIILAIILFPPATLAFVSNNAVPGDMTYPIKRTLENIIYSALSINPTAKTWFSASRSDRRYKEINVLISSGKQAKNTLKELVSQTDATVAQINQIQNPVQKQQLIEKYKQTIEKYEQGLAELNPSPSPVILTNESAEAPIVLPKPPASIIPTPPSQIPITIPSPAMPVSPPITQPVFNPEDYDIQDTIDELEKIKEKLKPEKKVDSQQGRKNLEKYRHDEDSKEVYNKEINKEMKLPQKK